MENPSINPLLLVPADDPICTRHYALFDKVRNQRADTNITVNISDAEATNPKTVANIIEILYALQHHPDLIQRLFWGIDIRFRRPDGTDFPAQDPSWIDRERIQFLKLLGTTGLFPMIYFFIQDPHKLYFAVMGDMILHHRYIGVTELQIVAGRVFHASRQLLLYCYGYDIDCHPYIHSLMDSCKVGFSFQELLDIHGFDIANGWPESPKNFCKAEPVHIPR